MKHRLFRRKEYAVLRKGDLTTFSDVYGNHSRHTGHSRKPFFRECVSVHQVDHSTVWARTTWEFFADPSTKSPLRLRVFVKIVNDAGKGGISAAPYCHLKMSSRKDRPVYHRGYKRNGIARFGAMESLVESPTAEPRGCSDGDEFFFLKLFLRYGMDSASSAGAAPIETKLLGVEKLVERLGFYSSPAIHRVL